MVPGTMFCFRCTSPWCTTSAAGEKSKRKRGGDAGKKPFPKLWRGVWKAVKSSPLGNCNWKQKRVKIIKFSRRKNQFSVPTMGWLDFFTWKEGDGNSGNGRGTALGEGDVVLSENDWLWGTGREEASAIHQRKEVRGFMRDSEQMVNPGCAQARDQLAHPLVTSRTRGPACSPTALCLLHMHLGEEAPRYYTSCCSDSSQMQNNRQPMQDSPPQVLMRCSVVIVWASPK